MPLLPADLIHPRLCKLNLLISLDSTYLPSFSSPICLKSTVLPPEQDAFICPKGMPLIYHKLNCNKSTGKYLRCYQTQGNTCVHCPNRPACFDKSGIRRRILASCCYPASYRGHQQFGTPAFYSMLRLMLPDNLSASGRSAPFFRLPYTLPL